jgi:hypothetical protein
MNALERAQAGYDDEHEAALVEAIITAIFNCSKIDNVLVVRTGEIAAALTSVLATVLALSPSATRSQKAIRNLTDDLRCRLIRSAARRAADPVLRDFWQRCFRDDDRDRGGRA